MTVQQVGNIHGVTAVGGDNLTEFTSKLSDITDSGVNTVTVDSPENIEVGISIDIVTKADGTVVAENRNVTDLTSAGVLTYSGADATTSNAEAVYPTGQYLGGSRAGFFDSNAVTVANLKRRLAEIDSGLYTDEYLNSLSWNDMVYAVRLNDYPETIN